MSDSRGLGVGTWIAIVALGLSVLTGGTVWMSSVFSSKAELANATGGNDVRDWRLQTLETHVHNLNLRTQRMDKNVDHVLTRFRIESEPIPEYKELPVSPKDEEEKDTKEGE